MNIAAVDKLVNQCSACITGTDDHDVLSGSMILVNHQTPQGNGHTVGKTDQTGRHKAEHKADDRTGPGKNCTKHQIDDHDQNGQGSVRTGKPEHFGGADKRPDTVVESKTIEHDHIDCTPDPYPVHICTHKGVRNGSKAEFIPDPKRCTVGNNHGQAIQKDDPKHFLQIAAPALLNIFF